MGYFVAALSSGIMIFLCIRLSQHLDDPTPTPEPVRVVLTEKPQTTFERARETIERELEATDEVARELAVAHERAARELDEARATFESGKGSLDTFRAAFQEAEGAGYPARVEGKELSRDDLLLRAEVTLSLQESVSRAVPSFEDLLDTIETLEERLASQRETAQMLAGYLENDDTRRELERDRSKLILLARQVERMAEETQEIQEKAAAPVPKLDGMLRQVHMEETGPGTDTRVLEFLKKRKVGVDDTPDAPRFHE